MRWVRTRSSPTAYGSREEARPLPDRSAELHDLLEGPVDRLVRALRALERAYSPGHHGRWSARRRSGLVDEAVRELAETIEPRVALVALGGYGREVLAPGSDIDLMVLHKERRADRVREAAERMFYPFWDAGIPLGHAVRTVSESVLVAATRLDAATALLDARLVAGDPKLFRDLRAGLAKRLTKHPSGFLERLSAAAEERHRQYGSCSHLLEPDLKEGSGGLRDIHSILWAGRVVAGAERIADLVGEGLLRAAEAIALDDAEEFLVRLRSALQLETGKRTDRVFLEYQPSLARAFGFADSRALEATDALMSSLFEHARHVEHVRDLFLDRARARVGVDVEHLDVSEPSSPDEVLEAFALMAGAEAPPTPLALDRLEGADLGERPYRWTEAGRRAFLAILAAGPGGLRALEAMDRGGFLGGFLPEWEPVRCRPQRDPYHRFTVDVHLLETAARAAVLLADADHDPVAVESAAAVTDPDALLLGALLHDVGKTGEGSHVPVGVRVARSALERMGVPEPTKERTLFLVEEHLLLSDTATRRDLSDENLIVDVAARVADPERLAMLYLLTAADAWATGPHAWTPWRQSLIRELVAKVEHVLERGEMGTDRGETLAERVETLRGHLGHEDRDAVERFLDRMPRGYLLAVPPESVARHFPLVSPPPGTAEVRTTAGPGGRAGTYEVTVVAVDRPGLLAKIAGALALSGLNILSAQVFTTEDGVALDLFVVEPAFEGQVDEDRWRRVRQDLRKAVEGRISLEYRVREKRRHYPRPPVEATPEVRIDDDASDFFTVVEVSAPDRIGLLFELARAFHELELDVHVAKVATYGGRVVDAFYVRNLFGEKVEDPDHRREIERALLARLREE